MRRIVLALVPALLLLALAAPAMADTHPSNGESSTGRNDAGFGEGPFVADPNCDGDPGN